MARIRGQRHVIYKGVADCHRHLVLRTEPVSSESATRRGRGCRTAERVDGPILLLVGQLPGLADLAHRKLRGET